ncbi:hypothetical protein B0H11DRAFT_2386563 [Mycena galericulata]|nr:hypothetical protein B0H11DRAFT_2386563 [Mycena galericulata]
MQYNMCAQFYLRQQERYTLLDYDADKQRTGQSHLGTGTADLGAPFLDGVEGKYNSHVSSNEWKLNHVKCETLHFFAVSVNGDEVQQTGKCGLASSAQMCNGSSSCSGRLLHDGRRIIRVLSTHRLQLDLPRHIPLWAAYAFFPNEPSVVLVYESLVFQRRSGYER